MQRKLPEYEKKRDFSVTSEPAPGAAAPHERPTFVVHKHDATRLHYDVRLEMDDALASWSVPKGPSYDPAQKRLAVQTEDHPLEYGSFEGRIPDGEYGAGDSLIWDRGECDSVPPGELSAQRKRGRIHVRFEGEKLKGEWHLVRTHGGAPGKSQWLMFKAKDGVERADFDVVTERPESVVSGRVQTRGPERAGKLRAPRAAPDVILKAYFPPMLATLVDEAPQGEWRAEVKYDGFRALCALSNGRVAMWTRNALDLNARFPGVARALSAVVVGDAVIDGELCVLDAHGVSRFELLHESHDQAVLFAFDLLRLDGEDLREKPLEQRLDLLRSLLSNAPPELQLAEEIPGPIDEALAVAKKRGLEGLLLKARGSKYQKARSRDWLKLKVQAAQELAIIGWTPGKGAQAGSLGALLLAVSDGAGGYRFAGKVGTGFTSKLRAELKKRLSQLAVEKAAARDAPRLRNAHWVEPKLVAQVRFTEWTRDGSLRHPSFQGLREDKAPQETAREIPAAPAPMLKLTSPDRVLYPDEGITKKEIADYYQTVAPALLRALADRPLALVHWNQGIHKSKWFQQAVANRERWMTTADTPARTKEGDVRHLIAADAQTLQWLAQNAVLELHAWHSRAHSLTQPDWVLFDLDPAQGADIDQAIEVAQVLRGMFERLGLPSIPKTTGKRGLHIHVPLAAGHTFDDAQDFALQVGEAVAKQLPQVTLERSIAKRKGRLYFDCLQNGYGKTAIAPYSPRGIDGAPVSAPLRWSEVVPGLDPKQFTVRTMPARLREIGDLFEPALTRGVRLPRYGR